MTTKNSRVSGKHPWQIPSLAHTYSLIFLHKPTAALRNFPSLVNCFRPLALEAEAAILGAKPQHRHRRHRRDAKPSRAQLGGGSLHEDEVSEGYHIIYD